MRWASGDGVSPSVVGPDPARRGVASRGRAGRGGARRGEARQGLRRQHGGPTGLPCRLHWWMRRGPAWRGCVGQATERRGVVRQGSQTVARSFFQRLPATLSRVDGARSGRPRQGVVSFGTAGSALARAADSSTELLRRLPAALLGGQMWQGTAWRRQSWSGADWPAWARRGKG